MQIATRKLIRHTFPSRPVSLPRLGYTMVPHESPGNLKLLKKSPCFGAAGRRRPVTKICTQLRISVERGHAASEGPTLRTSEIDANIT
jgi:hypothetical protein